MAWLSGWAADQRIEIAIDHTKIDDALTGFPVLVKLSASSGIGLDDLTAVFDELTSDANRKKIAITQSDGTTECKVEIEHWADANEKAALWVKVPSVSSSVDTVLYLYYDSSHADNTANVGDTGDTPAQAVWDSDFAKVLHMNSATPKDSVDGTSETVVGTLTLTDSLHAKALQALSDSNYIDCATLALGNYFTIETQHYIDTGGPDPGYDQIFGKNVTMALGVDHTTAGNEWVIVTGNGITWDTVAFSNSELGETTWYNLAVSFNDGTLLYRRGGASDGGGSTYNRPQNTDFHIFRRQNPPNVGYNFYGKIGEFRMSTIVRTPAWIDATSYSLNDNLITFSPPEGAGDAIGHVLANEVIHSAVFGGLVVR
jgi:hypothetical protein